MCDSNIWFTIPPPGNFTFFSVFGVKSWPLGNLYMWKNPVYIELPSEKVPRVRFWKNEKINRKLTDVWMDCYQIVHRSKMLPAPHSLKCLNYPCSSRRGISHLLILAYMWLIHALFFISMVKIFRRLDILSMFLVFHSI